MIVKGTKQISRALGVTKDTVIVLLQAGLLPAKKIRFGRNEAWVMTRNDVETILSLRENPPLVDKEKLGIKFVEQFGFSYPEQPLDSPDCLYRNNQRDIDLSEQQLPINIATPYMLIKAGLSTVEQWCEYVNDHRWRSEELGPLCLSPTELNRWAKQWKVAHATEAS